MEPNFVIIPKPDLLGLLWTTFRSSEAILTTRIWT